MAGADRDPNEILGARRADLVELAKIIDSQVKLINGLRATKDLQSACISKLTAERDSYMAKFQQVTQEKIALRRAITEPVVN